MHSRAHPIYTRSQFDPSHELNYSRAYDAHATREQGAQAADGAWLDALEGDAVDRAIHGGHTEGAVHEGAEVLCEDEPVRETGWEGSAMGGGGA